jgi:DNA-binding NarL/FixJ family response regulator
MGTPMGAPMGRPDRTQTGSTHPGSLNPRTSGGPVGSGMGNSLGSGMGDLGAGAGGQNPGSMRPAGPAGVGVASPARVTVSSSVGDVRVVHDQRATIRVVIIDPQPMFRRGIAAALAEDASISLVTDVPDVSKALERVRRGGADVVLCEVALLDDAGVPAPTRLRQEWPEAHLVVITAGEDDSDLATAVRAGARGYLLRDCTPDELRQAVVAAAAGRSLLPPAIASRLLDEFALMARRSEHGNEGVGSLSRREREVLGLVAEGLNNRAIAERLFISENTVKNHVRNIHEKLGVHTRMEAVVRAVREGLLKIA